MLAISLAWSKEFSLGIDAVICVQPLLTRLPTVDLPGLMVLPKRLEINIPPAVTSVAEAAVGHDLIMRAVASAVLQVMFAAA